MDFRAYFEKIIQKPIQLPAVDQVYIDQFVDIHIDGTIWRSLISDILQKHSKKYWQKIFDDMSGKFLKFRSDLTEDIFSFISDSKDNTKIIQLWKVSKINLFDTLNISKNDRKYFEADFPRIYQRYIRTLFVTLRLVKRFLASIYTTLPPIKDEVNLFDFMILEVIRLHFPIPYKDIWRRPWFYIPVDWSVEMMILNPLVAINEEEKNKEIKKHVDLILKNTANSKILIELLGNIFFQIRDIYNIAGQYNQDSGQLRREKRITHPECFKKYFTLQVSPYEISDEFIETTLSIWNSAPKNLSQVLKKVIKEFHNNQKLAELFRKLEFNRDRIERTIAPVLIRVTYENSSIFSHKETTFIFSSEFDNANSFLLWLINDKIEKNQIQETLIEVIRKTPDLAFMVNIVRFCKKNKGEISNIYDAIEYDTLKKEAIERLNKHFIIEKRNIFTELEDAKDWAFVAGQWATNWGTNEKEIKGEVNKYIFSLLTEDVKKFIEFLTTFKAHPTTQGYTFSLDELSKVYDLSEIKELAEKFKDDKSLSEEEKELINLVLQLYDKKFQDGKK